MTLICSQAGCPLATDGRCLEGLSPPDCPHVIEADGAVAHGAEPATPAEPFVDPVEESDEGEEQEEGSARELVVIELGGDESLSLSEAEPIAARYGARIVLVAGAFFTGKTTLVAGIYGLFLDGPRFGWSFAGSSSLMALDARYQGKRASSGNSEPTSRRTRDEDMRLLDLRLSNPFSRRSLMFSDVRGEYFEAVAAGQSVREAVPLATRADLQIIVLDGEHLADPYRRAAAINFARQLIGGLTEEGGLRPGRPLALVVTKTDAVGPEAEPWIDQQLDAVERLAKTRGMGTVTKFMTAAFARADKPEHQGMDLLLEWLTMDHAPGPTPAPESEPEGLRSFLRGWS